MRYVWSFPQVFFVWICCKFRFIYKYFFFFYITVSWATTCTFLNNCFSGTDYFSCGVCFTNGNFFLNNSFFAYFCFFVSNSFDFYWLICYGKSYSLSSANSSIFLITSSRKICTARVTAIIKPKSGTLESLLAENYFNDRQTTLDTI